MSFSGKASDLKVKKLVKNCSVSTTSRFVSRIIVFMILKQFYGMSTASRTVNMIIWSVLIIPQRNWSMPTRKMLRKMFVPKNIFKKPSAASYAY